MSNTSSMIARIWHGKTDKASYEAYSEFLRQVAIPDYKKTEGFEKLSFLRRIVGKEAHFTLITYWRDLEVIKNFAGADIEKAKYYSEDDDFLLEFDEKVEHYYVFA